MRLFSRLRAPRCVVKSPLDEMRVRARPALSHSMVSQRQRQLLRRGSRIYIQQLANFREKKPIRALQNRQRSSLACARAPTSITIVLSIGRLINSFDRRRHQKVLVTQNKNFAPCRLHALKYFAHSFARFVCRMRQHGL